jgi:hypothetical protein
VRAARRIERRFRSPICPALWIISEPKSNEWRVTSGRIEQERTLPDGLIALREELQLSEIMRLIERTARWVAPETFRLLPIWFPEYARGVYFYKGNSSQPQLNKSRQTGIAEHKREVNVYANKALTRALGLRSDGRQNWSCCHVWGIDDALYQANNTVVQDRCFYSCVANMVLLPTPLKAFTDAMPDVKAMLRICARNLYGWHCPHESMAKTIADIDAWHDWSSYPASWPRDPGGAPPPGVMQLDDRIRSDAKARLTRIRSDLDQAGPHYPKNEVHAVLAYWHIEI